MPPKLRALLGGALVGAAIGVVILGIGGRLAMYAIAVNTSGRGLWTFGGTLTVVALGGVSGAAGGALHVLSRWVTRGSETLRRLLYVIVMLLITWRGLDPVTTVNASYFFPLVVTFMLAMEVAWLRGQTTKSRP